jgi:hypothetical protein
MKDDKIITPLRDFNFMYEISAYRKLTQDECKNIVKEYMQLPDHESPKEGKIIKIDTVIH